MKRLALSLTVSLFAAMVAVVALASQGLFLANAFRPDSPLILLSMCDPQPCWHGIRPGVTTLAEAQALLQADGLIRASSTNRTQVFWYVAKTLALQGEVYAWHDELVNMVKISVHRPRLTLERLSGLFGTPQQLQCRCSNNAYVELVINYRGNVVAYVQADQRCDQTRVTASQVAVQLLLYDDIDVQNPALGARQPWTGYGLIPCSTPIV